MVIVLMGYMASGKSFIGKVLAKKLNYNFIDLDNYIEEREGKTISEIFESSGAIYFRKIETKYLKGVLDSKANIVLSLGGGTPCYGKNLDLVLNNKNIESFYLKTTIPELLKRLKPEKNNRPIISHLDKDEELIEFFGKHLFERSPFYSKSDYAVSTDNRSTSAIVEEIVLKLI